MINLGSILPIGTVIHSMLTTTQFAAEYGDNWVLADGRSVTGTKYALVTGVSTIPDMRDVFLRGKGNGRGINADGDLALGTYTDDKFESHDHQQRGSDSNPNDSTAYSAYNSNSSGGTSFRLIGSFDGQAAGALTTVANGNNETAPKSVIVNIFIRIN